MTKFEKICTDLNLNITTDEKGFYTGHCLALYGIICDFIDADIDFTDDDVKERFLQVFPYKG